MSPLLGLVAALATSLSMRRSDLISDVLPGKDASEEAGKINVKGWMKVVLLLEVILFFANHTSNDFVLELRLAVLSIGNGQNICTELAQYVEILLD